MQTKVFSAPYAANDNDNVLGDFDRLVLHVTQAEPGAPVKYAWFFHSRRTGQEERIRSKGPVESALVNYFFQTAITGSHE